MKYRIRCSRVKATCVGKDEQLHPKYITADEIIVFDHDPSDEEIQNALNERLFIKNPGCMFQYKEVFEKEIVK
ncbi:MAG: hypothetical protein Q8L64_02775 [bacterium]|nr:hypothetical protein [bacterium]